MAKKPQARHSIFEFAKQLLFLFPIIAYPLYVFVTLTVESYYDSLALPYRALEEGLYYQLYQATDIYLNLSALLLPLIILGGLLLFSLLHLLFAPWMKFLNNALNNTAWARLFTKKEPDSQEFFASHFHKVTHFLYFMVLISIVAMCLSIAGVRIGKFSAAQTFDHIYKKDAQYYAELVYLTTMDREVYLMGCGSLRCLGLERLSENEVRSVVFENTDYYRILQKKLNAPSIN